MGRIQREDRKRIEEQLIKKVWEEPKFFNELTKNPNVVLKQEFGVDIPNETKVNVHKETVNEIHIVIPKY